MLVKSYILLPTYVYLDIWQDFMKMKICPFTYIIYIDIHALAHTLVRAHTDMDAFACACTCTHTEMQAHTHIHTDISTNIHVHAYVNYYDTCKNVDNI